MNSAKYRFELFDGEIFADRRDASPNHAQVGQLSGLPEASAKP